MLCSIIDGILLIMLKFTGHYTNPLPSSHMIMYTTKMLIVSTIKGQMGKG